MKKKFLIVDDSAFMRKMLKDILTEKGYEITGEAESSEEAVVQYKKLKPDLVTMDMIMPGKNGIEAVKEIIKIDKDAKILMVSAMGQEALVKEAIETGAKNFIIKPFQAELVLKTITEVLGE